MAILTNQAWRVWRNPNSLWARVLKAKYFPHNSLQDSKSTLLASHIWKAIHQGSRHLFRGMLWILGNGSQVNVV